MQAWRILATIVFLMLAAAAAPAASAQGLIAIKDGKVLTITRGIVEPGTVLIRDGKIEAVGANLPIPPEARVIDARGLWVYPGLIDAQTHLGLVEISAVESTRDLIEPSHAITPHMRTRDAIHAESELIEVARVNGITTALVVPAETNTVSGQSALIHLYGANVEELIFVPDAALHINFGPQARREEGKFPSSRMGLIAQLRQALLDAQNYQEQKKHAEQARGEAEEGQQEAGPRAFKRDLKLEAFLPYLNREKPVVVGAREATDIKTIVRLLQEFDLRLVLNHITYAQDILDEIASWKLPVLVGPIYSMPKEEQRYDAVFRLPAELHRRGIKFAFQSNDAHGVRNLPYQAGYAVAWGLPYEEALKALTIYPAEIFSVGDQVGSLEPGKLANVVIADGDPLEPRTVIKHVFIKGQEVPLDTRQLRLYRQYTSY